MCQRLHKARRRCLDQMYNDAVRVHATDRKYLSQEAANNKDIARAKIYNSAAVAKSTSSKERASE